MASPLAQITLAQTIETELPHLLELKDAGARRGSSSSSSSWSPKEELGHLIDSAANNHIRFVRAALEGTYSGPPYAQNEWVDIHGYQDMEWSDIVSLWHHYNRLMVRVMERIPASRMESPMTIGPEDSGTLRFVIDDYVSHLRHHIDHLLGRSKI